VAAPKSDAARLFEEYGPQLYRFCLGRMRSREEAEDALQSTFLRVHKALAKGTVPEFEAAWLYKIAHNVCLSRHDVIGRRGKHETAQDLDTIEYALAAPEEHHDELVGLSDALADMPPKLRQAILLREWQGLSYAEIATAMGTTVSAVETLIFRARRHLAGALETDGRKPVLTSRGLSIAALLGRLRTLLVGVGPAKLAAGAALMALGGAGIGSAVALNQPNAWNAPRASSPQPTAAVPTVAFVQQARAPQAPVAGVSGRAARPDTTVEPAAQSSSPVSEPQQSVQSPAAPSAAAPSAAAPSASVPATLPAPALPAAPVAPVAPTVPGTEVPPLVPPALNTPTVPSVQAPPAVLPPVETPTLPALPTVTLPTP